MDADYARELERLKKIYSEQGHLTWAAFADWAKPQLDVWKERNVEAE